MPILPGVIASSRTRDFHILISSQTVGAGGASSVTFSSIPSTYSALQIRALVSSTAGTAVTLRFNGDTTVANYYNHYLSGNGSTVSGGSTSSNLYAPYASGGGVTTSPGVMIMDILDYKNTSKNKVIRVLSGYDANGSGNIQQTSGVWLSTAAITSMTFTVSFNQFTTFALYGVS